MEAEVKAAAAMVATTEAEATTVVGMEADMMEAAMPRAMVLMVAAKTLSLVVVVWTVDFAAQNCCQAQARKMGADLYPRSVTHLLYRCLSGTWLRHCTVQSHPQLPSPRLPVLPSLQSMKQPKR
eukprot:14101-Pleurochrysis_carterae.AAC.1